MPISKGTTDIGAVFKGTTEIASVYKGTTLVYENYKTLTTEGVPPLTLNKCKNTNMLGYKVYGNSKQQLLPDGYTQLEYIESDSNAYINTGFSCTKESGLKIKYRYTAHGSAAIAGVYTSGTPQTRTDALFVSSNSGSTSGIDERIFSTTNGYVSTVTAMAPLSLNTDYEILCNYLDDKHVYCNGTLTRDIGTNTPNNSNIYLFARYNATNDNVVISYSRIYYAIFSEGNAISKHFIPAKRNSDNVLGMYDIINNEFKTNVGTGSFTAGPVAPTPNAPIEIESVGDKTKNLFDKTNALIWPAYININNNYVGGTAESKSITISCKPNTTYTISHNTNNIALFRACYINSEMPDIGRTVVAYDVKNDTTDSRELKVTTGNQCKYVVVQVPYSMYDTIKETLQIEVGSTATAYEPYGYKIPITVCGKNICNPSSFINTGKLLDGINGGLNNNTNYKTTDFAFIKAGTYTLSLDNTYDGTGNTTTRMCLYNTNYGYTGNVVNDTSSRPTHPTYTFTIANDCYYRLSVRNTDTNVQLEKSGTETAYEPYVAPRTTNIYLNQPLRKIGNADAVNLPSGYTQLEYIQSTGTQYIDTGFTPNQDTKVDIEFTMKDTSGKAIYGSRIAYDNSTYSAMLQGNSAGSSFQYNNVALANTITYQNNQSYNIVQDKNKLYINGTLQNTFTYGNFTCPGNLYLFAVNQNGTIPFYGKIAVHYFKVYDNNVLIRYLVPCKNSDNVVGMYDTINDVFYQNAGSDTFTAGPEIYADYIDYETQKVYRNVGNIDLSDTTYTYQSQYTRFRSNTIPGLKIISGNWTYALMSDIYGTTIAQNFNIGAQGGLLFIWDNRYTDATALKTALAGHYLNFALGATTEESVTLPSILLNKGTNIISVDTSTAPSDVWIKYKGKP